MAVGPIVLTSLKHVHAQFLSIVGEVTPEQAAFRPAGTANPIGPTIHHVIAVHDRVANVMIAGRESQWTRGDWANKLGLPTIFRLEPDNVEFAQFDVERYRPYLDAVFAETVEVVEGLSDDDLEREVLGFRGPVRIADLIGRTLIPHFATHLGEIAAVKGFQGLKGLP